MFCQNCGTQLKEDSKFCTSCGNPLNGSTKIKSDVNASIIGEFIYNITSNPLSAAKNFVEKVSIPFILIYFSIISILSAITNAFAIKGIISQYFTQLIKLYSKIEGDVLTEKYLFQINSTINPIKETLFPFGKTFSWILIFTLIFYLLMIILVYLYHNVICKTAVNWKHYFVVASVALTIQLELSILLLIASLISLYLSLGILMLSLPMLIIVLYKGFDSFIESQPTTAYIFSLIYAITSLISSYIFFKMVSSHFIKLTMNGLQNIFDIF